jgi:hypothetical protein
MGESSISIQAAFREAGWGSQLRFTGTPLG